MSVFKIDCSFVNSTNGEASEAMKYSLSPKPIAKGELNLPTTNCPGDLRVKQLLHKLRKLRLMQFLPPQESLYRIHP